MIKDHIHENLSKRAEFLESLCNLNKRYNNYLDLGSGSGDITNAFSKYSNNSYGIDNSEKQVKKSKRFKHITFYQKEFLEFQTDKKFDLITAFSFFEHLEDLDRAIDQVNKLSAEALIIQVPNKYFIIDLNTYLPIQFLFPLKLRLLLQKLDYSKSSILAGNLSVNKLKRKLSEFYIIESKKIIYPKELIPGKFRTMYSFISKLGVFNIIPFGYILICHKK